MPYHGNATQNRVYLLHGAITGCRRLRRARISPNQVIVPAHLQTHLCSMVDIPPPLLLCGTVEALVGWWQAVPPLAAFSADVQQDSILAGGVVNAVGLEPGRKKALSTNLYHRVLRTRCLHKTCPRGPLRNVLPTRLDRVPPFPACCVGASALITVSHKLLPSYPETHPPAERGCCGISGRCKQPRGG